MEITYAVSLGYKVLEIYETHHYGKQEKIFDKFMKTLAAFKLKVSNYIVKKVSLSINLFFLAFWYSEK